MSEEAVNRRLHRAAERLLDDERLQGRMTDREFQPLLDWAMATIEHAVLATVRLPDAAADVHLDAVSTAARRVVEDVDRLLAARGRGSREWSRAVRVLLEDVAAPELVRPRSSAAVRARLAATLAGWFETKRGRSACDVDASGDRLTHELARLLSETTQHPVREIL